MESVKPARVFLRVIDSSLSLADRNRIVRTLWNDLTQLELTEPDRVKPIRVAAQGDTLCGLDVRIPQPECLEIWIQDISDRLGVEPVKLRLTCIIERLTVQLETASSEEVLRLLPVLDTMLPARQIYQARAALYAQREGEFSPVEEENLDLLRYQLQLDPDTAEQIKNRVLGPYQDRQTKLERYQEVLNAELDRHPSLSKTTYAELDRLREALGLAPADVEEILAAAIARRQPPEPESDPAEADDNQSGEGSETPAATAAQSPVTLRQNYTEQYRQEFASAIARTLYPSEFDRGRLEQARRDWQLDKEMARAIEREVTDERYGPVDSSLGIDYTRLRQLLWLNRWDAADQETERLLLSALSQDMRPLADNAILSLSQYCVDVHTIDRLWSKYSQGKFGFAAQQQAYAQQERQPADFLAAIAWVESVGVGSVNLLMRRRAYRDLQFNLQAPAGHLPTWRWAANSLEGDYAVSEEIVQRVMSDLIEKCMPHLKKTTSSSSILEAGDKQS